MQFHKYHALGNDYLVLTPQESSTLPTVEEIKSICHRNFGIGSDGILYGPLPTKKANFSLRIFNPDGSEAEKSGNGLRIFAQFLHDNNFVESKPFTLETMGGIVKCEVIDPVNKIKIEMGRVVFLKNEELEVYGKKHGFHEVSIGNPHCVILMERISKSLICEIGPVIETDPRFPNRINVQLLEILDESSIRIQIWERGAGYTLASGSSSCAAAAVAYKLGKCKERITVHMPGGNLEISISANYEITMTGPTTYVGLFVLRKF